MAAIVDRRAIRQTAQAMAATVAVPLLHPAIPAMLQATGAMAAAHPQATVAAGVRTEVEVVDMHRVEVVDTRQAAVADIRPAVGIRVVEAVATPAVDITEDCGEDNARHVFHGCVELL